MCGISGFFHPEQDFAKKESYCQDILDSMNLA